MENSINKVDVARNKLRNMQSMLFDEFISNKDLFQITVEIDNLLNEASTEYNKNLKK